MRTGAAKNKLFFFLFFWKMFQLGEFSNPFPQAARVGSRQPGTRMGLAMTALAGFSGAAIKCSATEMPVGGQENFLLMSQCIHLHSYP